MKTLKFIIVAITVFALQGCETVAIGMIERGIAAATDTGEARIVLSEGEGGKADTSALQRIQSVVTDSEIAASYLREYQAFERVVVTSQQPLNNQQAAKLAKVNNVDAYYFSTPGAGGTEETGVLWGTVVYGSVTISIVDLQGEEVYRQKISLERGESYAEEMLDREVIEVIAIAVIEDIRLARAEEAVASTEDTERVKKEGWLSKINPLD